MKIIVVLLVSIIFILSLLLIKIILDLKNINKQTRVKLNTDSNFTIVNDLKINELNNVCEKLNLMYQKFIDAQRIANIKEKEFKEMLAYIAHDVRTPLTSVQGYLQILEENPTTLESTKYYEIINHRLLDIKNLLEQFFFYSKLVNDDYRLETKDCNLYDSCCLSLTNFYQQFVDNNIEPQINFSNKEMKVHTNQELLIRVFDNLIHNALVHGEGALSIVQKDNSLYFSNPVKLPCLVDPNKVFERFYKADTSRSHISSGLGLSIVYEMMQRVNGSVEASLEDNIFTIIVIFK